MMPSSASMGWQSLQVSKRRLIFRWMVVAIVTGNTVSGVGRMGFMVEEDFPGSGFVHDADRLVGRLGGKGCICVACDSHN